MEHPSRQAHRRRRRNSDGRGLAGQGRRGAALRDDVSDIRHGGGAEPRAGPKTTTACTGGGESCPMSYLSMKNDTLTPRNKVRAGTRDPALCSPLHGLPSQNCRQEPGLLQADTASSRVGEHPEPGPLRSAGPQREPPCPGSRKQPRTVGNAP